MRSSFYEFTKTILRGLIPRKARAQVFASIRKSTAFFYSGSKHKCSICEIKLSRFQHAKNGNILCPNCGSTERARSVWGIYKELSKNSPTSVLHFSPNPSLQTKFKKENINHYLSSDFSDEFAADVHYDITAIPEKAEQFDLIICMHVLEHIGEDQKAMQELHRVLAPTGMCIIQTPYKEGDNYENPEFILPEDRLKHFGQEDHVRIYSVEGLQARLLKNGLKTRIHTFSAEEVALHQLSTYPILLASKN